MSYFINFLRVPKAGKTFEVLEAMKKAHSATGRPGNITIPVSGANLGQPRPGLISLVGGFETLDDIDQMQNGFTDNGEAQKRQAEIDELCDKTNYFVSEMIGGPEFPDGYQATIISRLGMIAKPGDTAELIERLLDVREKLGGQPKNVISRPLAGPIGQVRVTMFGTSLQDVEDRRVASLKHLGNIPKLISGSPIRNLGRIVYSSRG
jgi:hypothetical protein|tara:strand:- start:6154 stop:6774 length:621 start_codon:yes stop_codon:yes gene_type:complete